LTKIKKQKTKIGALTKSLTFDLKTDLDLFGGDDATYLNFAADSLDDDVDDVELLEEVDGLFDEDGVEMEDDNYETEEEDNDEEDDEVLPRARETTSRPAPRERGEPPPPKKRKSTTNKKKKKDVDEDWEASFNRERERRPPMSNKMGRPEKHPELRLIEKSPDDGLFHCPKCDATFEDWRKGLVKHFNRKHDKVYHCHACPIKFNSKFSYDYHRELIHNDGKGKTECLHCDARFRYVKYLERHMLDAHPKHLVTAEGNEGVGSAITVPGEKLRCKFCVPREAAVNAVAVADAETVNIGTVNAAVDAAASSPVFSTRLALQRHFFDQHADIMLFCEGCDKPFMGETTLMSHVKKVHRDPRLLKPCSSCSARFASAQALAYHEDDRHEDGTNIVERPFVCGVTYCLKRFRCDSFLKKHSKVHIRIPHDQWGKGSKVGEEEEDAEEDATTTETETSTTSSALVAMKTSESSEKQQCPICGRMVSQTGLSSHIKDHEAVKCGECGAEFPNRYQKDNHKALVHDKMTFTCPHQDCSKTFFSRKLLKHHFTSVHTARHKCDLCEKSFAIKHDLHTHIRGVHEGIKVYCAFCGKDFIRPSEKNRHEKQVHGAEINKSAFF